MHGISESRILASTDNVGSFTTSTTMAQNIALRIGQSLGLFRRSKQRGPVALVLSGGGARGAYQAGVLKCFAERVPDFEPELITGVSAGALNAVYLASAETGRFVESVESLCTLWKNLTSDQVFDAENSLSAMWRLVTGRRPPDAAERLEDDDSAGRGIVDTRPMREFLLRNLPTDDDGRITGIDENIRAGRLTSIALLTANYSTGQNNAWVEGAPLIDWDRPSRRGYTVPLTVDHVLASAALPFFFPAVRLGDTWHGDGGIRLTAPLAPALHLGADRIVAISTRTRSTVTEGDRLETNGYPPAAQIFGLLMNAVFLDVLDMDVSMLEAFNRLLKQVPKRKRLGKRPVDALVIRPSTNLEALASRYDPAISTGSRFVMRLIGAGRTGAPAWLSMLNFNPEYISGVLNQGYMDARERIDEIEPFLA